MINEHLSEACPLCYQAAKLFYRDTHLQCEQCGAIFRATVKHLNPDEEKKRYLSHNNDVNDSRYQNFVKPIVDAVTAHFGPQHQGLDFGAGTGPVISKLLTDRSYKIRQYDPFFHPHSALLKKKYDYIVACEVIEHFHKPREEFNRLTKMLLDRGMLFIMTMIYDDSIEFARWFYKNDESHCFFYREKTLHWIQKEFSFSNLKIDKRLIIYTK